MMREKQNSLFLPLLYAFVLLETTKDRTGSFCIQSIGKRYFLLLFFSLSFDLLFFTFFFHYN